mmetsp:Transcript_44044/g.89001  ORF Transcript_44044/g.89001 Transcript_44044/m.89001 type:complete len:99 (+) Transcript_44044:51-347(+)
MNFPCHCLLPLDPTARLPWMWNSPTRRCFAKQAPLVQLIVHMRHMELLVRDRFKFICGARRERRGGSLWSAGGEWEGIRTTSQLAMAIAAVGGVAAIF